MTVPARIEIDDSGAAVLVGPDRRWPFEIDLSSGAAVLRGPGTNGGLLRVRPLRWGEKVALARFATLGPRFLAHAVAGACASVRPAAGPDDDAVAALVDWLELPGEDGRATRPPLDPTELAAITLELCRLTGMPPSAFADLPAADVAQLLAAARWAPSTNVDAGASPERADEEQADAQRRIVIIDDPSPDHPSPPARGEHASPSATVPRERDEALEPRGGPRPDEGRPDPPRAVETRTRAAHGPGVASDGGRAPAVPVRSAISNPPTWFDRDTVPPREARDEPVPRTVLPDPVLDRSHEPGDRRESAHRSGRVFARAVRNDVPASSERRIGPTRRPASLVKAARPEWEAPGQPRTMMSDAEPAARTAGAALPFAPRTTAPNPVVRPDAGVAPTEPADPEALLQALADDLDRAATALGIGPGTDR